MRYPSAILVILLFIINSCKNDKNESIAEPSATETIAKTENKEFLKLSLAQWSLHKPIMAGELSPLDFPQKAKELGFEGVEYASILFRDELKKYKSRQEAIQNILIPLKLRSDHFGVENLVFMIDDEGDLASSNEEERNIAVRNHSVWIDAAEYLGCHSIRVNLFASEGASQRDWVKYATESLRRLATYAQQKNMNVIVENHGGYTSNAALLTKVISIVNMPNCGTLPDFGNFCLKRQGGVRWEAPCIEEYDKYKGIQELMVYAKAVSAKSYAFDENGNETSIDYPRMLRIVKESGYQGYIGIEFEGENPEEGIKATKELILKVVKEIK